MRQQLLPNAESPPSQQHHEHHHEIRDTIAKVKQQAAGFKGNVDLSTSGYGLLLTYLCSWKASIYRLVWIDVLVWLVLYYILNLIYRLALNAKQKLEFENLVEEIGEWQKKIPVTFLLGFFVSNVMSRWWSIFKTIPRMSGTAHELFSTIHGGSQQQHKAERAAYFRVTIGRYLNLAWALALTKICACLRQRFQSVEKLTKKFGDRVEVSDDGVVSFGMDETDGVDELGDLMRRCLSDDAEPKYRCLKPLAVINSDPAVRQQFGRMVTLPEMEVFLLRAETVGAGYSPEWLLPIYWSLELANKAKEEGLVRDSFTLLQLQSAIRDWSAKIRTLTRFAKRHLPLVYTQVVIVAVYTVYCSDIFSRQILDPKEAIRRKAKGYYVDYLIPVLAIVHVMYLIGWFKVGMVMIDPFGNDDEDFPFSAIFNGNLKIVQTHCGDNRSWFPRKVADDANGPESDDEQLQDFRDSLEEARARRRQQYGTFD